MKKTVIVNIPMTAKMYPARLKNEDSAIPVSEREACYGITPFLEKDLHADDDITILMVTKENTYTNNEERILQFKQEMDAINENIHATIHYVEVSSPFEEDKLTHERLMQDLAHQIVPDSSIYADITYGPKDVPIIEFAAISFAKKFLGCRIGRILYRQGVFNTNNEIENIRLCDMGPLFSLHSLVSVLNCKSSEEALLMLDKLVPKK